MVVEKLNAWKVRYIKIFHLRSFFVFNIIQDTTSIEYVVVYPNHLVQPTVYLYYKTINKAAQLSFSKQ